MYPIDSPIDALSRLVEGNLRFRRSETGEPASPELIHNLYQFGQHPWAVILTCSDSRVPPELLFQCGLGELFVIRSAGHALDRAGMGSVEYAVLHLGVRLVLVLGHTNCGAVAAALEETPDASPENLSHLLALFEPALSQARSRPGLPQHEISSQVENVHTRHTVQLLRENPVLSQVEGLAIVGGKYNTCTGEFALLDLEPLLPLWLDRAQ